MRHHLIRKLQQKKHREETGLFLVEGETSVLEALEAGDASPFRPDYLAATDTFLQRHGHRAKNIATDTATPDELARAGTLASNDAAILILRKPADEPSLSDLLAAAIAAGDFLLALDTVNDPGNLGTIIRIADWYGIRGIAAARGTVETYNPKCISASKGSFLRVCVASGDLAALLRSARERGVPVYAASLDGTSLHELQAARPGILLLGSETHGISADLCAPGDIRLTIPRFGGAESLNVAIATGILLDTLRRITR